MRIAIYPGSFNPFHEGHEAIVKQALKVFDLVLIAQGVNEKKKMTERSRIPLDFRIRMGKRVRTSAFRGLLKDFVKSFNAREEYKICAIIRGLRDVKDFKYEQKLQYAYEDSGVELPIYYVIADRSLVKVSSTKLRNKK